MRLTKTFPLTVISLLSFVILYISCRKFDRSTSLPEIESVKERFFKIPAVTNPVVVALHHSILREEEQKPFVNEFVTWAGFPRWDKAIIKTSKKEASARTTSGEEIVYIPFLGENDTTTHAILVAKIDGTDTLLKMFYRWQYRNFPYARRGHAA